MWAGQGRTALNKISRAGIPLHVVGSMASTRNVKRLKKRKEQTLKLWRRGWDSNPRYGFPYARFRGEYFQPLSHLSAVVVGLIVAERCVFRQSSARFECQRGVGRPRLASTRIDY